MDQFNVTRDFPDDLIPDELITSHPRTALDILRIDVFSALYSATSRPHQSNDLEAMESLAAFQHIARSSAFAPLRSVTLGHVPLSAFIAHVLVEGIAAADTLLDISKARADNAVDRAFKTAVTTLRVINATGTDVWIQTLPDSERMATLKLAATNATLEQYAKEITRFKHLPDVARAVDREGETFRRDNDLSKLTVKDLTALTTPQLNSKFWADYAASALEGFGAVDPTTADAKGGYVIVIDESSSIRDLDMQKARAFALILCEIANSRGATGRIITTAGGKTRHFTPINGGDRSELFNFIRFRHYGATNLSPALDEASALATDRDHVVVITDYHKHQITCDTWDTMRKSGIPTTGVLLEGTGVSTLSTFVDEIKRI